MSEFFGKLFGLREVTLSDPGVRLELAREWAPWVWAFLLLAATAFAAWSYWRLIGPVAARASLATLRTLTIAALLVMIAGPQLVKQSERIEKDWVVVLVDRSASMKIADVGDSLGQREDQLRQALIAGVPSWNTIRADRNLLFLGFDAGAYDLKAIDVPATGLPPGALPVTLADPEGRRTSLARSIDQALRRVASRPVAGLVVISDGKSDEGLTRPLQRQIEARQVPIFPVPLGSPTPIPDFAVARVEAPPAAFKDDLIPVSVEVEGRGLREGPAEVRVELVNELTGEVLAQTSTQVVEGKPSRVLLTSKAETAGASSWIVRVVPPARDVSPDNNSARVAIDIADRPIRVAYFDGYPRWEYRYLKNILVREASIKSSAMLLAGDKRFIQEGTDPIASIPRTPEEWAPFDVLIMGDVRASLFGEEQLKQIKEHVARRGAGLLWIAGPGSTPTGWFGTPLADLLPFGAAKQSAGGGLGMPMWLKPVKMAPAPAAERYAVLRLGSSADDAWPEDLTNPAIEWSNLRWAQRLDRSMLKPTAEVLANAVAGEPAAADSETLPLVVTMRYGAGRIIYVATDEIWRLRYGRGEVLPERFYVPLLRLLARDSLSRTGKPAFIEVNPTAALVDQPVSVTLRVLDESLLAGRPAAVAIRVTSPAGDGEVELRPEQVPDGESPTTFTGTYVPNSPGQHTIAVTDAAFAGLGLAGEFTAAYAQDELRDPQTDHALLQSLADASGGKVLQPAQLAGLNGMLPNRQVRIVGAANIETLWDKPIVWVLLMVLLGAEWIGRRLIRLS